MARSRRGNKSTKGRSHRSRRLQVQPLEQRLMLTAQPIISEFQASNDDTLRDDNGNSSDWIEIFNAGSESVDLAGYSLTDNPNQKEKWVFPSVVLNPNQHLVVFAGTDADPNSGLDLYTGFNLSAGGEFLGLYDPAGTALSEFEPTGSDYAPQYEDLSYGLQPIETQTTALAFGADSQYLVPNATTGPLLGDLWRQPDYVLGSVGEAWQTGGSGFGYENSTGYESFIATDVGPSLFNQGTSLFVRSTFDQTPGEPIETLALNARYDDGFIAYLNGVEVLRVNGPSPANDLTSIKLDNLFDDAKGTAIDVAMATDTYGAVADSGDLGVYTVIRGGLNVGQTIAPGLAFNLASAGGGPGDSGGPANDVLRAGDDTGLRTTGFSGVPDEKVEDGIGTHADSLITFDINELRTAGGFGGVDGYFTARTGLNDSASTAGSVKAIVILSDANSQVISGYVNGQRVNVSQSGGGDWSFTGSQPGIATGTGATRLADIAVPITPDVAYLTLAGTSNNNRNNDHVAFAGTLLEFQSIALGNLFDDPHGSSLTAAIASDTPQSRGDTSDLGVIAVGDGNFQATQTIAPLVQFDFSNVGSSTAGDGIGPSNDTVSSDSDQPIRTRDIAFGGLNGVVAEDGIGLPADEFITFDLEELRTAGSYASDLEFRFKASAAINDDATGSVSASGRAIVVASDTVGNVLGAWINGQIAPIRNTGGVWSVDLSSGLFDELDADSGAAEFDVALPSNAAYLTLVGAGGTTNPADHLVFAGARLQLVPDADGVSWQSTAAGGSEANTTATPDTFDLTNFVGLVNDGTNVLAIHSLNTATNSSDFLFTHEIVTGDLGYVEGSRRYFVDPTPGTQNNLGVQDVVENTSFSVPRGFYNDPISVAITTPTADASVYYTTDFSLPGPDNPNATLYAGPVTIGSTTNLRAAAYRSDFAPSYIDTASYVFVEDVIVQDPLNDYGNGVSPDNGLVYPETWQGSFEGDYGFDPRITGPWDDNNPANDDFGIRESLLALPTFSLTLDHGDAFRPNSDPFTGIVTNSTNRGEDFRHTASIEYFDPATGDTFQANAAVQAQGNSSRGDGSTRKHSYRLIFNETLGGPGKLNFPLFDNSDFDEINTFTLKVASTDGFTHRTLPGSFNAIDSTLTRDAYLRQLQANTGHPLADSSFAHVYINGLYWGIYTPIERPDDAFHADRFGGEREDWDVYRDNDEFISGNSTAWNQMRGLINNISNASSATQANALFQQLQGRNADGSNNPNIEALMNVDNFIDYMAIHYVTTAKDWPHRNWYAARNRVDPSEGFQFYIWDQGQSLDQAYTDRTERGGGLGTLLMDLRNSPEFRLRFADRIQKHFFNNGVMTLDNLQQTWSEINSRIEPAIVAETARWGDAREGLYDDRITHPTPAVSGAIPHPSIPYDTAIAVPLLTIEDWRTSVNWVQDDVLPLNFQLFFQRMAADGLLAAIDAPQFLVNGTAQHGGVVEATDDLSITSPTTIYYTIDGSDPREAGGAIVGTEFVSELNLSTTTLVKARSFSGGQWSALTEAAFVVANNGIVISEINYNPTEATNAELAELGLLEIESDKFEFIEITNAHPAETINLLGMQITMGVTFTAGNVSLAPGERAVVVEDEDAFKARYGNSITILGEWSGGLSAGGEELTLVDAGGSVVMSVEYNDVDPWSVAADGAGATLVLDDPSGTPAGETGKYYRWRSSTAFGGTPGTSDIPLAGIVINEVLAHSDLPTVDAIELLNPTNQSIDISGWYLSDEGDTLQKFAIPEETILDPGQYITFDEADFNPTPTTPAANHFALNSAGDQVYLVNPNGVAGIEFVDAVDFGATFNGESVGRTPNGTGRLAQMLATTFGSSNSAARIAEVVISEVNYHPDSPTVSAQNAFRAIAGFDQTLIDNDLEFIEIHNPTAATFDLTNWRLRGESDLDFAAGTTLAAGEHLVLVTFDPTADAARLAGFRDHYGIGSEVTLVGTLSNNLNNSFGRVELQQPDVGLQEVTHVTADEVLYDDLAPWPIAIGSSNGLIVDGGGASLERVGPTMYGNAATSWLAASPSPGLVDFTPSLAGDYDRNGIVEQNDLAVWRQNFNSLVALNADGNGNGVVDAADYTIWRDNLGAVATTAALAITSSVGTSSASEGTLGDSQPAPQTASPAFLAMPRISQPIQQDELLLAEEARRITDASFLLLAFELEGPATSASELEEYQLLADEPEESPSQHETAFTQLYGDLSTF